MTQKTALFAIVLSTSLLLVGGPARAGDDVDLDRVVGSPIKVAAPRSGVMTGSSEARSLRAPPLVALHKSEHQLPEPSSGMKGTVRGAVNPGFDAGCIRSLCIGVTLPRVSLPDRVAVRKTASAKSRRIN